MLCSVVYQACVGDGLVQHVEEFCRRCIMPSLRALYTILLVVTSLWAGGGLVGSLVSWVGSGGRWLCHCEVRVGAWMWRGDRSGCVVPASSSVVCPYTADNASGAV